MHPGREDAPVSGGDAFGRILAALHEAALDPAGWDRRRRADRRGPGRARQAPWRAGTGNRTRTFSSTSCGPACTGNGARTWSALWLKNYFPADKTVSRMRHLPFNRTTHITDLYTDEELKTSVAYRALRTLAPCRERDQRSPGRARQLANPVADQRPAGPGRLDVRAARPDRAASSAHPPDRARTAVAGRSRRPGRDADTAARRHRPGASSSFDARGRIVAANDRALSLLRNGDALCDKGGFLIANEQANDEALQAALARALPPFGDQGEGGSMTIRRPKPLPPLVLHVNPLSPREAGVQGMAGGGARAAGRTRARSRNRSGPGRGRSGAHADGGPCGGDACRGHERARDRHRDAAQAKHDPLPRQAHLRQARTQAPRRSSCGSFSPCPAPRPRGADAGRVYGEEHDASRGPHSGPIVPAAVRFGGPWRGITRCRCS